MAAADRTSFVSPKNTCGWVMNFFRRCKEFSEERQFEEARNSGRNSHQHFKG
jgi:hypothetical protein